MSVGEILMDNDENMKEKFKIDETNIACPFCKKDAILSIYEYQLPLDESILIITIKCPNCGFKESEIFNKGSEGYSKCIELKIENDVDLNTLVYINPGTILELRDLGITIEVHRLDIGYIVTVEALIIHIVDVVEAICKDSRNDNCIKIVETLNNVIGGRNNLTIVLRDQMGITRILKTYRESNFGFC